MKFSGRAWPMNLISRRNNYMCSNEGVRMQDGIIKEKLYYTFLFLSSAAIPDS